MMQPSESSLQKRRFPVVGITASASLLGLLVWAPEMTTIWATAVATGVVCGYLLARFPLRRLTPTDLRKAQLEGGEGLNPGTPSVDSGLARGSCGPSRNSQSSRVAASLLRISLLPV